MTFLKVGKARLTFSKLNPKLIKQEVVLMLANLLRYIGLFRHGIVVVFVILCLLILSACPVLCCFS